MKEKLKDRLIVEESKAILEKTITLGDLLKQKLKEGENRDEKKYF